MDIRKIQKLIKIVETSEIDELSIEDQETKISIKKTKESLSPTVVTVPAASSVVSGSNTGSSAPKIEEVKDDGLIAIVSPMIGTFYRAPSPDAPSFVEIGDHVDKGQIVCIIEAMKLFNEIESDLSGKVEKILVKNGEAVEYGQKLMLLKPEDK